MRSAVTRMVVLFGEKTVVRMSGADLFDAKALDRDGVLGYQISNGAALARHLVVHCSRGCARDLAGAPHQVDTPRYVGVRRAGDRGECVARGARLAHARGRSVLTVVVAPAGHEQPVLCGELAYPPTVDRVMVLVQQLDTVEARRR